MKFFKVLSTAIFIAASTTVPAQFTQGSLFESCGSNVNILNDNLIDNEDFVQLSFPEVEAGVHCHDTLSIPVYVGKLQGRFTHSVQGTMILQAPLDILNYEGKADFSSLVVPYSPYFIFNFFNQQTTIKDNIQGREQVFCIEVPSPKKLGTYKLELIADQGMATNLGLVPVEVATGISDGNSPIPYDVQSHWNNLLVTSGNIHVKEMNCLHVGN